MKRSNLFRAALFMGVAVVLGSQPVARAAMFSNGGFESPDISGSAGGGIGFLTGTDGWKVTETAIPPRGITIFDNNNPAGPASEGTQFITLRNDGTSATIQQTFDTIIGADYVVNWDEGYASTGSSNFFNPPASGHYMGEVFNDSLSLLATTGDRITTAFVHDDPEATIDPIWGVTWAPVTLAFTATSATSTLRFTQTSNSIFFNSYGVALDNVFLQVPEPASLSLLAAGGLLLIRRRRA
jgi:hypothetical protein